MISEAPTTAEGSKKPESSETATDPMPAAPAGPAPAVHAPAMAQRFFVVSQPQVASNPAALPTASNGAVSTYLLLRNQPVHGFPGQVSHAARRYSTRAVSLEWSVAEPMPHTADGLLPGRVPSWSGSFRGLVKF